MKASIVFAALDSISQDGNNAAEVDQEILDFLVEAGTVEQFNFDEGGDCCYRATDLGKSISRTWNPNGVRA